jgi:hypothetical protein
VELAGLVTGVGGLVLTATQAVLPAMMNFTGQVSMGVITAMAGLAVWWRKRKQRLQDEDRPTD